MVDEYIFCAVNDKIGKLNEAILKFIKHFNGSEDVFLNGCCYWFAWILNNQFSDALVQAKHVGYILYEPIEGHFVYGVCAISDLGSDDHGFTYYDVRGDVTDIYKGKRLYTIRYMMDDMPKYYEKLMRECRDFEEE